MRVREGHDRRGGEEKRKHKRRCSCQFVLPSTSLQLSSSFSLDCLLLSVMSQPLFCLSSSIIISRHLSLSLSHCLLLSLSLLCLGKRRSRNKAINKKSTAFSVPPHYRLLMYAFCSSITHQPQTNAIIFPPARLISVAVTTVQRGVRSVHCRPFPKYKQSCVMQGQLLRQIK